MKIFRLIAFPALLATLLTACEETVYTPKPRGYPRIEYPEKTGEMSVERGDCPFTFQIPAYYEIRQDSFFFDQIPPHSCWFDLYIPEFDSRLHCSYLPVGQGKSFDELRSDAFDLANWHNKKADYIDEIPIKTANGVEGIFFNFEGEVASQYQFYLTDSLHQHFFRVALYFNTQAKPDSLAPVTELIRRDVDLFINSFRWE
jgi:gliding motility-associated lipoprotein GldD